MSSPQDLPSTSSSNCIVCQESIMLHPSLTQLSSDNTSNEDLIAVLENRANEGSNEINSGKLLELMCQSQGPLETPMCKDCCSSISNDLTKQLKELDVECLNYKSVYDNLMENKGGELEIQAIKRQLEVLEGDESDLRVNLENLQKMETELLDQLKEKQSEKNKIVESDEELYRQLRNSHRSLLELQEESRHLKAQIKYAKEQKAQLMKTNVLDMTFFIWIEDDCGLINGLRLGRLANGSVDWLEINAAFGQIAMLLVVMFRQSNCVLNGYEIVPCGSHSLIRVIRPDKKDEEYPLYGTGSWKPFGNDQLDNGIMAYVRCFSQLVDKLKDRYKMYDRLLPYKIVDNKIIDGEDQYLVRMRLNSEERWTRAMKYLLIDLKRILSGRVSANDFLLFSRCFGIVHPVLNINISARKQRMVKRRVNSSSCKERTEIDEAEPGVHHATDCAPNNLVVYDHASSDVLLTAATPDQRAPRTPNVDVPFSPHFVENNSRRVSSSVVRAISAVRSRRGPKKEKDHPGAICYLLIVVSSLWPQPSLVPPKPQFAQMETNQMRTLFDPMIGEFCADTSPQVLNAFFNSKMRFRNDKELANFAWNQEKTMAANAMAPAQMNMVVTGSQMRPPVSSKQPSDPSLIDYEAIDVYWRRDIEQEKGGRAEVYPMSGQSTSRLPSNVSEQFERDLQLLKEKSLFVPLTNEETFRYENLSKAHYADFYVTVPNAAGKRMEASAPPTSSSYASSNFDSSRSNVTNFDEDEAADYFANLAKESTQEEPLQTYSNLTLGHEQSAPLLNNASLTGLQNNFANESFFQSSSGGLRGSAAAPTKRENDESDLLELGEPFLEMSESEANAVMNNMQQSREYEEVFQLHEFIGMEMLGEFAHPVSDHSHPAVADVPLPDSIFVNTKGEERETSPSSGIGSMQSSSASPNYGDEENTDYRFYGKLAPKFHHSDEYEIEHKPMKIRLTGPQHAGVRKRGRQSKDEQLAREYGLPASAEEFAAMSHMEIQSFMRDPKLNTQQKNLIKKIRRRGRNKVAARKCRERRSQPTPTRQNHYSSQSNYDYSLNPSSMSLYDF